MGMSRVLCGDGWREAVGSGWVVAEAEAEQRLGKATIGKNCFSFCFIKTCCASRADDDLANELT